jgi:NAD-dependent dihydropyrimidine dehydrogenase PreA subunit
VGDFPGHQLCHGGAWIFYFADAPTLQREFWTGAAPGVAYACVAVLTFTTFWLGGFMREQVCVYMCPWPRIQSAMLDEKSLIVTYKDWRGEPRGSLKQAKRLPGAIGDCIDCKQCVAVCPTGIDIREGAQIGCITCGLCIDACDRVMGQVGRERGLIDYCTLEDAEHERKGGAPKSLVKRSSARARWSISGCGAPSASACCSCWAAHPPGPVGARDRNPNSCSCPTDRCATASPSSCATWKTARAHRAVARRPGRRRDLYRRDGCSSGEARTALHCAGRHHERLRVYAVVPGPPRSRSLSLPSRGGGPPGRSAGAGPREHRILRAPGAMKEQADDPASCCPSVYRPPHGRDPGHVLWRGDRVNVLMARLASPRSAAWSSKTPMSPASISTAGWTRHAANARWAGTARSRAAAMARWR